MLEGIGVEQREACEEENGKRGKTEDESGRVSRVRIIIRNSGKESCVRGICTLVQWRGGKKKGKVERNGKTLCILTATPWKTQPIERDPSRLEKIVEEGMLGVERKLCQSLHDEKRNTEEPARKSMGGTIAKKMARVTKILRESPHRKRTPPELSEATSVNHC